MDSLLYVFPVIGGREFEQINEHEWRAVCQDIYGTAFTLGPGVFLTAGHSLRAAAEQEFVGLGEIVDGTVHVRKAANIEIIDDYDIGLMKVPWGRSRAFPWTMQERPMLERVHCVGYPYALDPVNNSMGMRAFAGHIVSTRDWPQLHTIPRIYELSYQCPRGLSGAPLWTESSPVKVVGVILGNSITEMEVYSEKETDSQGEKTIVYQKVEALHLGVALQTAALMDVRSSLLGKTIGEHLREMSLFSDGAYPR